MSDAAAVAERDAEQHSHSHRDVNGGWLRPAVFGAMDGLVTNVSLIAGIAAAAGVTHTHVVVVTGIAGLLAGAFSMAVGEWTSVHSQAELVRAQIGKEGAGWTSGPARAELVGAETAKGQRERVRRRAAERAELAALFASRGLP